MIMAASILPDLDGIFSVLNPFAGYFPGRWHDFDFSTIHHTFGHNIFFAILVGSVFAFWNRKRRLEMFGVCTTTLLIFHLGIDNLTNDPTFPIMIFWPVSHFDSALGNFSSWPHLRFLTVWVIPGFLSLFIWTSTVVIYKRTRQTFLQLVSVNLDKLFTNFIVLPFSIRCSECENRARYRCQVCGKTFCIKHCSIGNNLVVTCNQCASTSDHI